MKLSYFVLILICVACSMSLYGQNAPEENRFTRVILDEKLNEPTELAVLEDGRVFYIERKGKMKMYNPKTKTFKVVAEIPVYTKFEYGLMGLNVDPNFKDNKWVYLFYSPPSETRDTAQRLSRFVYDEVKDTLVFSSEKIMLRVPVKRTECCHTGGSVAWDKDGNLFLSTGDDTNPFASEGYGPMDNRPGRQGWDARASSSNTNDLRGKILRIKPLDDGTYKIPSGNLFAPGLANTRPEIYVMGCRNPYRIAVDQHTSFLYWGEVGPDAGTNSDKFGPRGYDEVNQARQAGYFGWPLFVADNKPYAQRDFTNDSVDGYFDPQAPINTSPHNTGIKNLPPAQKALIYYPYADSPEFGPVVGKGGRNAMGGPVFYSADYDKNSTVKFPDYYNGKFFHYDWIRDWVNVATLSPTGDFIKTERFLPGLKFSHPMDMQFNKDGSLYMLEYGPNWFAQNDDARLTRITFNAGNRPPVAEATASHLAGAAPLLVKFDASASLDYDKDAIAYEWKIMDGAPKITTSVANFTFAKPGIYNPVLKVTDAKGNVSEKHFEIRVGNAVPVIDIALKGNKSFFWPNRSIAYEVNVADKEDGSLKNKKIPAEDVFVSINYLEGYDKTEIAQGHQMNTQYATGKRLIELSDCKSCHNLLVKSAGPAFTDISKKYKGAFEVEGRLSDKIIKGGNGVWGEQAMNAHPQVSKADALEMVRYILSISDEKKASKTLKGSYVTKPQEKDGNYIIAASYTDRGTDDLPPNAANASVVLRNSSLNAFTADKMKDAKPFKLDNDREGLAVNNLGYIAFDGIDLTDIASITVQVELPDGNFAGGNLELRIGSPIGRVLGTAVAAAGKSPAPLKIPLNNKTKGAQDLYLVFVNPQANEKQQLLVVDKLIFEAALTSAVPNGSR
jgi:cytochrome c